jgi:hypothetical protein
MMVDISILPASYILRKLQATRMLGAFLKFKQSKLDKN